MTAKQTKPQIKTIWGLSKEVGLDKENLYALIIRLTGKDSMRQLTNWELNQVVKELGHMKDQQNERPSMANKKQIWKIHELEKELGWDENPARLIGFMKKFYHVEQVKWLKSWQAHKLIESLKKMVAKMEGSHES